MTEHDLPTEYPTFEDLIKKGEELFGADKTQWVLECPCCKAKIKVATWIEYAGSPETANNYIGFSCVGRLINIKQKETADKNDPIHQIKVGDIGSKDSDYCNYTAGGLFNLNPVLIKENNGSFFQFAPTT